MHPERMRLCHLPDDILIPIFALCDLDSLLASRLVARPFRAVIDSYITKIAPSVAHTTFPDATLLLKRPKEGYSLRWLRGLIPAQLASIILDKDKLRRHCYINAGFPYGIPVNSDCLEANRWRTRIANGWRLLRCFYLISRDVYMKSEKELYPDRPRMFRRVSSGMRSSNLWQSVSCPYQACTEHGVKGFFDQKKRRDSEHCASGFNRVSEGDHIEAVRKREHIILKKRLAWLETLSDHDLLDYLYLWRLLLWVFRPYRKPDTTVMGCVQGKNMQVPKTNWKAEVSGILHGCSWLNWFVLHVGSTPFWRQWWSSEHADSSHYARNLVWRTWNERSHHQVELEREFVSKFEFALRKRCLSPDRMKRLDDEIMKGRVVKTISLDCIPWEYDQPSIINRPPTDFPWYGLDRQVWLAGDVWAACSPLRLTIWKARDPDDDEEDGESRNRGPLARVPFLVYLGIEESERVWGATSGNGEALTF